MEGAEVLLFAEADRRLIRDLIASSCWLRFCLVVQLLIARPKWSSSFGAPFRESPTGG
jgi:hypothetical protein